MLCLISHTLLYLLSDFVVVIVVVAVVDVAVKKWSVLGDVQENKVRPRTFQNDF